LIAMAEKLLGIVGGGSVKVESSRWCATTPLAAASEAAAARHPLQSRYSSDPPLRAHIRTRPGGCRWVQMFSCRVRPAQPANRPFQEDPAMLRPTFPASARLLLLLAGCLLACGQALAWGELGHRTIAALAEQALAPTARAS